MKAEIIKVRGSFTDEYYAIKITEGFTGCQGSVILQTPAFCYPCGPEDEESQVEGLNETAKLFFQEIVDKINNEKEERFVKSIQGAKDMSQVRRFLIQFGYGLRDKT